MKKLLLAAFLTMVFGVLQAQNTAIKGTVKDENGKALVGVTVQVKGTSTGTVTDAQGDFELNVPDNAILVFSYVGYDTKEVPVQGKRQINVVLSNSSKGLNEVVVVGSWRTKESNGYRFGSLCSRFRSSKITHCQSF